MKPDAYLTGPDGGPNYLYHRHQKAQAVGLSKANAQQVHELYRMRPFMCRNCGSRISDEELADKVFGENVISCCPERSIVTMDDIAANWADTLPPAEYSRQAQAGMNVLLRKHPKPKGYKLASRGA